MIIITDINPNINNTIKNLINKKGRLIEKNDLLDQIIGFQMEKIVTGKTGKVDTGEVAMQNLIELIKMREY